MARINYCPNPGCAVTHWPMTSGSGITNSRVTNPPVTLPSGVIACTKVDHVSGSWATLTPTPQFTVEAGAVYRASIWVHAAVIASGDSITLGFQTYNGATRVRDMGGALQSVVSAVNAAFVKLTVSVTIAASGEDGLQFRGYVAAGTGTYYATACLVEKPAVDYVDGSFANFRWTAGANTSPSVEIGAADLMAVLAPIKAKTDTLVASPVGVPGASFDVNLIKDPRMAHSTAGGWDDIAGWTGTHLGSVTKTIVADTGFNWQRIQYTGQAGDTDKVIYLASAPIYESFYDANDPAALSFTVKGAVSGASSHLTIYAYDSNTAPSVEVGNSAPPLAVTYAAEGAVVTVVWGGVPSGTRWLAFLWSFSLSSDTCSIDVQISKPILTKSTVSPLWFRGATSGAFWAGPADAAWSIRSVIADHAGRNLLLCSGNSLSYGQGATRGTNDYPTLCRRTLGSMWDVQQPLIDGDSLATMLTTAAAQADPLASADYVSRTCVLWEGTNDLNNSYTAAASLAHYRSYCDARRVAGYENIIVMTVLPTDAGHIAQFGPGWEPERLSFNAALRATYTDFADILIDLASHPVLGDPSAPSSPTYYRDGLHLTPAGYSIVADLVVEAVLKRTNPVARVLLAAADAVELKTDAKFDAVLLKTNTIGSLAVTVTSPVAASGTITVYSGDDYASADARAITVAVPDAGHVLGLTAVGAVVKLKATQGAWTASSVASTTDGYTVTFEATAAQTAAITRAQRYELEATLANGHVVTLARGSLVTRTNIPAVV